MFITPSFSLGENIRKIGELPDAVPENDVYTAIISYNPFGEKAIYEELPEG